MIKGIHHIALVVRNFGAALRFYTATAGMTRVPDTAAVALRPGRAMTGAVDAAFEHGLLAGRNGFLELIAPRSLADQHAARAGPINALGIRHFCIQNRDCARLEQAVLGSGGSLIAPPLDLGTGNQYAYGRDAEANIMEIEGLPYAPAAEPTWLAHVAVVTHDMDAAVAFYTGLFGAGLQNRGRFGPQPQLDRMGGLTGAELEGAWLPARNMLLELWQFHVPPSPPRLVARHLLDPGYSHIGFETDDLDVDLARLAGLGGDVLGSISENDYVRSAFGRDPEGNLIELVEPRPAGGALSIAALAQPGVCARVEAARIPAASGRGV